MDHRPSHDACRRAVTGLALLALASCATDGRFDPDLRGWVPGALTTAPAAERAAPRPAPDARGVITFPNAQVAVARPGDTVATVAARLGLSAADLARHNALAADAVLAPGAILALPRRVTAGAPVATGGPVADPFAGQPAASGSARPTPPADAREHVVAAGETAWSIARRYGVDVADLAQWNGLPPAMTVRTGQRLLIPGAAGAPRPAAQSRVTAPGVGSPTPEPPSASRPLPDEKTDPAAKPVKPAPAVDLGATRTAASGSGRFRMPVEGSIIRVYEKGRNEGIDISAPAGQPVRAAGPGSVAAITEDVSGLPIVVIRHDDGLLTVYAGLIELSVAKGDRVTQGQPIGKVAPGGNIHFEVRRGFESLDPETYL